MPDNAQPTPAATSAPTTARRIGIDAFNMALPKGSGIATYARNLNLALRDLGHSTHLLYGPINPLSKVNLLNEVSLFDAFTPRASATWVRRAIATASMLGRRARPIQASPEVQARNSRPPSDGLWAARDLYHRANRGFISRRRFTNITFAGPKPPRDLLGTVVDQAFDPLTYVQFHGRDTWMVVKFGVAIIDSRTSQLDAIESIERSSIDFYATTRNLYRQSRNAQINEGRAGAADDLPNL